LTLCAEDVEPYQPRQAKMSGVGVLFALWRQLPGVVLRVAREDVSQVLPALWMAT